MKVEIIPLQLLGADRPLKDHLSNKDLFLSLQGGVVGDPALNQLQQILACLRYLQFVVKAEGRVCEGKRGAGKGARE